MLFGTGEIHVSASVKALVGRFQRSLGLAPGGAQMADGGAQMANLITLHVRRGDTVHSCNTSVPAVLQFLDCSTALDAFEGAQPSSSLAGMRLVVFTDESDATYLRLLTDGLTALPRFAHAKVTHGDPILAGWVHTVPTHTEPSKGGLPDNYEVYAAAANIMSRSALTLEIERCSGQPPCATSLDHTVCHPCVDYSRKTWARVADWEQQEANEESEQSNWDHERAASNHAAR